MAFSSSELDPIEELVEEFLARRRRGERPSVEEYLDRYPALASGIRAIFPAMAVVNDLGTGWAETEGGGADERTAEPKTGFVGDYRIIREIGRGGMGVVYEAEQVSLGRRVALKLLPERVISDAKHRGRFEREARAAAQLHHTNIVPVFGVGEHEGCPYYVMQLIDGRGLDAVIAELRRFAQMEAVTVVGKPPGAAPTNDHEAAEVARSLLDGRLGTARASTTNPALADSTLDETRGDGGAELASGGWFAGTVVEGTGESALSSAPALQTPNQIVVASPASSGSSSDSFAGKSGPSSGRSYWQAVARVGAQVAEALAHAHAQGIVHRDIKPSNLLLDSHGLVWVADFGLAKATDSVELTETGEVLGTWRYMPPEAFRGQTGPLGDVYSLGLTLYEMIALKPGFDQPDRARLIHAVTESQPAPLRDLARKVPRDLETIVRKATEREPSHRYASAALLAEDLRRFAQDRPIAARRIGQTERLWRWSRRNPLPAGLAAGLVLALVLGAAGSGYYAVREASANQDLRISIEREHERFNLALEAIRFSREAAAEEMLLKEKRFAGLRSKLLQNASAFYVKLERQLSGRGDRRSRAALAGALYELGELATEIESKEKALEIYTRALELQRVLLSEQNGNSDALVAVAKTQQAIGRVCRDLGRNAQGLLAQNEAARILEPLAEARPDDVEIAYALERTYDGLMHLLGDSGRFAEMFAVSEKALPLQLKLAKKYPGDTRFKVDAAKTYFDRSLVYHLDAKTRGLVRPTIESALAEIREVLASEPENPEARNCLGVVLSQAAAIDVHDHHTTDAAKNYQQSCEILEKCVSDYPTSFEFRSRLAHSLSRYGDLLLEQGKRPEAVAKWDRGWQLADENLASNPKSDRAARQMLYITYSRAYLYYEDGKLPEIERILDRARPGLSVLLTSENAATNDGRLVANFENFTGALLANRGRHADAVAAFRRAISAIESKYTDLSQRDVALAIEHAMIYGVASMPNAGDAVADKRREGDLAMAALRRVLESKTEDVSKIASIREFAVLGDRADFQSLVLDATFPANPFAGDSGGR